RNFLFGSLLDGHRDQRNVRIRRLNHLLVLVRRCQSIR
ncbi:AAEL013358-PA, partial [Aedes aegypti]